MRGADLFLQGRAPHQHRFIPTCVGQIHRSDACQEMPCGSSPHAWGRYLVLFKQTAHLRFIPTCVGQIKTGLSQPTIARGSSPHAWGRLKPDCLSRQSHAVHPHMRGADTRAGTAARPAERFIPTCVGQMFR